MKNLSSVLVLIFFIFTFFTGCQEEAQNVAGEEKNVNPPEKTKDSFSEEDFSILYKDNVMLREKINKQEKEIQRLSSEIGRLKNLLANKLREEKDSLEKTINNEISSPALRDIIEQFKQGADKSKIAEQLKPFGKKGVSEIIKLLDNFDYRKSAEELLVILPKEDTLPLVRSALDDKIKRIPACRILGFIGEEDDVIILEKLVNTQDRHFRLTIADSLVKLKSKTGIPVLIEFLKSEDNAEFSIAFATLKKVTGQDFGIKLWETDKEKHLEAAKKFAEWWENNKETFEFK